MRFLAPLWGKPLENVFECVGVHECRHCLIAVGWKRRACGAHGDRGGGKKEEKEVEEEKRSSWWEEKDGYNWVGVSGRLMVGGGVGWNHRRKKKKKKKSTHSRSGLKGEHRATKAKLETTTL